MLFSVLFFGVKCSAVGTRKAQNLLVTGSNDDEAAFFSERSEAVKVKRESDYEIEALEGGICLFDFAS